jgi:hypothetical protein
MLEIKLVQNKFNAYSVYPLNISLMGINPVKDIDYTVYDTSLGFESEYWYNRSDDISTYYISISAGGTYTVDIQGSYTFETGTGLLYQNGDLRNYDTSTLFNTFDSSVYLVAVTDTLVTYAVLDGSILMNL